MHLNKNYSKNLFFELLRFDTQVLLPTHCHIKDHFNSFNIFLLMILSSYISFHIQTKYYEIIMKSKDFCFRKLFNSH